MPLVRILLNGDVLGLQACQEEAIVVFLVVGVLSIRRLIFGFALSSPADTALIACGGY